MCIILIVVSDTDEAQSIRDAALAQQAEHFLGKEEVGSSNLLGSSNKWTISSVGRAPDS